VLPVQVPGLPPVRAPGLARAQNRLAPGLARAPQVQVLPAQAPVPPELVQRVPARLEPEPTPPGLRGWTRRAPRAAGCRCPCRSLQPNR